MNIKSNRDKEGAKRAAEYKFYFRSHFLFADVVFCAIIILFTGIIFGLAPGPIVKYKNQPFLYLIWAKLKRNKTILGA